MLAQRFVTQVTDQHLTLKLPAHFNNHRVEVIVLELEAGTPAPGGRQPHPDIAGKLEIAGDIFSSVPESDWDLPA